MLKENQSKPKIQVPASCVASGRGVRPCPQPPHAAWAAPGGTARGAESSAGQDEAPGGGEAGACSRELAWLVGKPRLVATGTKSLVSMATAWFGWLLQMPSRSGAVQAPTEHRHSAANSGQSSPCPVPAPLPAAAQPGAGPAGHRPAAIPHEFSWEPLLGRGLRSHLPRGKGT